MAAPSARQATRNGRAGAVPGHPKPRVASTRCTPVAASERSERSWRARPLRAARVSPGGAQRPHARGRDRPDRLRRASARVRRGEDRPRGRPRAALEAVPLDWLRPRQRVRIRRLARGLAGRPRARAPAGGGAALRRGRRAVSTRAGGCSRSSTSRTRGEATRSRGRATARAAGRRATGRTCGAAARRPGDDRRAVLGRRVADVLGEPPARVALVGAVHVAVARDLGDDRGGGDRRAGRVAVDDRACWGRPRSPTEKPSMRHSTSRSPGRYPDAAPPAARRGW